MLLACQRNSALREIEAEVLCVEQPKPKEYHVILSDTVLFPEGGGQPWDTGVIGEAVVSKVVRDKQGRAVHVTDRPLEVGSHVLVKLDWQRRYDHMTHHTAQHLISAVAEDMFGWLTACWGLGSKDVTVDLTQEVAKLQPGQIDALEEACNAELRRAREVRVEVTTRDAALLRPDLRPSAKAMPEGIQDVRLVAIDSVDLNLCCGTHVHNLSEIQVIKFYGVESNRGNSRLLFRVGQRVLAGLAATLTMERHLSDALSCGAADFGAKVEKICGDLKTANRQVTSLKEEIGSMLAQEVIRTIRGGVAHLHRSENDAKLIGAIADAVLAKKPQAILVVTTGEPGQAGTFLVAGSEDKVKSHAASFATALGGKGGGRGTRYMGKYEKLDNLEIALDAMRVQGDGQAAAVDA